MNFLNKIIEMCSKKSVSNIADTAPSGSNTLSQNPNSIKSIKKNNLYIHPDLIDLIWIGDGKYKNYQNNPEESIVYPYEGFKIKVSLFGPDEPSLL